MGHTMIEKILKAHAISGTVSPGQYINCRVDIVMGEDITAPVAIREFEKTGAKEVFDPERIALVPDHFAPNKDIASAGQIKLMREFAKKYKIKHFFEVGEMGIEHVILPELGIVGPGDVVVGADSHTCTYGALSAFATGVGSTDMAAAMALGSTWFKVPETMKIVFKGRLQPWVSGKDLILHTIGKIGVDGAIYRAMEFCGDTVKELSMADRFTMANMAVEAGAKCGYFLPDEKTREYAQGRFQREAVYYTSDEDAEYAQVVEIDAAGVEPCVAFPHLPENVKSMSEIFSGEPVVIDQVVIGSCTNGRIEDLRTAANVLKGQRVAKGMRLIVIPGSQAVYRQAVEEGIVTQLIDAGAAVSTPTCGPCVGGYMGILAAGERCVSTTNRNFIGRMGHVKSEVYLASPAVAAASAVLGRIGSPTEV
ncbi:MAG TPA: 3-isopropylmalate dehydratase large subunit [Anaerovoracaceae bacterium]|nr:3-isopropylmalate dehydratase large subunit [Anaerovoracaceae bacterium]